MIEGKSSSHRFLAGVPSGGLGGLDGRRRRRVRRRPEPALSYVAPARVNGIPLGCLALEMSGGAVAKRGHAFHPEINEFRGPEKEKNKRVNVLLVGNENPTE